MIFSLAGLHAWRYLKQLGLRSAATAAGARCTATLLHEMNKRGKSSRFGIVSMCIGSGMGAAAVFERGGEVDNVKNARSVATQDYLSRDAAV